MSNDRNPDNPTTADAPAPPDAVNRPGKPVGSPAWITWALILWAVLAIAITIKTVVSPDDHTVFPKFAARAEAWGSRGPLYASYEGLGRFPYSPTFAVFLVPFAALGLRLGGIAWTLLNLVVYVWGLRRLVRDVLPAPWPPIREGVFLMLATVGAVRGLWNAQSNALIIGLLMLGMAAAVRRRWWPAGFLMAGAVYLKVWPIVIPLLLLALRPRRFALPFGVAMVVGAVAPFAAQHPAYVVEQYQSWFAFITSIQGEVMSCYRDVWTVLHLLGIPISSVGFHFLQGVTAAATLGWCLWQRRRGAPPRWLATYVLAIGTAWCVLLVPAIEYNTYVVLAPMVAWALLQALEDERGRIITFVAFFMTMVLGAGALERLWRGACPPAVAVLPVGTLVFAVWLIHDGARRTFHADRGNS
jgi:hypothetical protein